MYLLYATYGNVMMHIYVFYIYVIHYFLYLFHHAHHAAATSLTMRTLARDLPPPVSLADYAKCPKVEGEASG